MKQIENMADFEELANVTAIAAKRYNVLGKTLTVAKDQLKTYMKGNGLNSLQKNGVRFLSLTKSKYDYFNEGLFAVQDPEAYKNWKELRDKFTEVRYKESITWHNVETLFPDEYYEVTKNANDLIEIKK